MGLVAARRLDLVRASLSLSLVGLRMTQIKPHGVPRLQMVQVDLATETSRPWSTAFREALSRG
jgi:hypothetical protein